MEDNKFTVEIDGKIIEYTIIKILLPKNSQFKYLVYTENGEDIYASRFKKDNDKIVLEDIEYQYEFDYIDKAMEDNHNAWKYKWRKNNNSRKICQK